jgi:hypothetical protein
MSLHSCRTAARLLSQAMDEPLGRMDRFQLRLHLFFCLNCRHVQRSVEQIRTLSGELFKDGFDLESPSGD